MALITPTLLSMDAFDATKAQVFTFVVTGGDQVVANKLKITLNDGTSTTPVYEGTVTSFKLEHTLPANTLTNGQYYVAQVQTYNVSSQTSSWSNTIQFRCFNTPSLSITNIPATGIINNSSFNFVAQYAKAQSTDIIDEIESYIFTLYDASNLQIASSGMQYFSTTQTPPVELSYTFRGFNDNVIYGINVVAHTLNGMTIDSGISQFTADYIYPSAFSLLNLENVCDEGYIKIISNVAIIDGIAVPDPPTYIGGKEIDLTASGSSVSWNEGYSASGDFTVGLWGRKFTNNARIFLMKNEEDTDSSKYRVELYRRTGYPWDETATQKMYFECYLYSGNDTPAYVYSNYINTPADTDTICIWLKRQDNILDLQILNKGASA